MQAANGLSDRFDEGPGLCFVGRLRGVRVHDRADEGTNVVLVKNYRREAGANCGAETIFVEKMWIDVCMFCHQRGGVATGIRR